MRPPRSPAGPTPAGDAGRRSLMVCGDPGGGPITAEIPGFDLSSESGLPLLSLFQDVFSEIIHIFIYWQKDSKLSSCLPRISLHHSGNTPIIASHHRPTPKSNRSLFRYTNRWIIIFHFEGSLRVLCSENRIILSPPFASFDFQMSSFGFNFKFSTLKSIFFS